MRISESEALALGLVKDKNGNWHDSRRLPADFQSINSREVPKPKRDSSDGNKKQDENETPRKRESENRYLVRVTAFRKRCCDPDNVYSKHYIDQLEEHGIIPNDSSDYIEGVIKRCVVDPEERTEIEIFEYKKDESRKD